MNGGAYTRGEERPKQEPPQTDGDETDPAHGGKQAAAPRLAKGRVLEPALFSPARYGFLHIVCATWNAVQCFALAYVY